MDVLSGQNVVQGAQPIGGVAQPQAQPQVGYQQPVVVTQPATPASAAQQNGQALFTQEQLNSIIGGRLAPIKLQNEALQSQLAQAQQAANTYLSELNGYKQRETARAAGVPEQFINYAVYEAGRLAVNGKEFSTALNEFIAANQSMFGAPQATGQQVVQTPAQGAMQPATQPSPVLQPTAQPGAVQPVQPVVAPQPAQPVVAQGYVGQPQPPAAAQQVAPAQFGQVGSSGVVMAPGGVLGASSVEQEVAAFLQSKKRRV